MKVAFVLNSTDCLNGATKAFLSLMHGLCRQGVECCVVLPDAVGVCGTLRAEGIATFVLPYRGCVYPALQTVRDRFLYPLRLVWQQWLNYRAVPRLSRWLQQQHVDIVHTNVGVIRIGFDAARRLGIPHVYHIREYASLIGFHYFPSRSSFLSQLSCGRSYSICITRDIQRHYQQTDNPRSRVVYDAACPHRDQLTEVPDGGYFLCAGRVEPTKGVDLLLEAYASYARHTDTSLPLLMAGNTNRPDYLRRIKQLVADQGVDRLVSFLGPRKDIEQLMRQARALIVASEHEGFGLCMAEAMSVGCLVIGRDTTGSREQMDNGVRLTGEEIALRFGTAAQLAACLQEVTCRPATDFLPMRRRAFHTVNACYTPQVSAEAVYGFYQEILKNT